MGVADTPRRLRESRSGVAAVFKVALTRQPDLPMSCAHA